MASFEKTRAETEDYKEGEYDSEEYINAMLVNGMLTKKEELVYEEELEYKEEDNYDTNSQDSYEEARVETGETGEKENNKEDYIDAMLADAILAEKE